MAEILNRATSAVQQSPEKIFPTPETNLYKVLNDPQYRRSFHGQLKRFNPFIVAFYRIGLLPLFGVSKTVMLLTTRGRKSGKMRSTPIGYFRIGGEVYLLSAWGKGTGWYQNLKANPEEVWIQIGLRKRAVHAEMVENPADVSLLLERFMQELPEQAHNIFGWVPGIDRMQNADCSQVIQRVLFIRFCEKPMSG